jgi:hypothetical protein
MPGKRVRIDEETWVALHQLGLDTMKDFQDLADEAFDDLLRKYHRPVGLRAALKASAGSSPGKPARMRKPRAPRA